MKKLIISLPLIVLLTSSCSKDGELPPGFEVVFNQANIFFVYLHEELLGDKSGQRGASTILCDSHGHDECEVYMWSKKDLIPKGLPIRNEGSYIHSYFKRDSKGKKDYKCLEC